MGAIGEAEIKRFAPYPTLGFRSRMCVGGGGEGGGHHLMKEDGVGEGANSEAVGEAEQGGGGPAHPPLHGHLHAKGTAVRKVDDIELQRPLLVPSVWPCRDEKRMEEFATFSSSLF